MFPRKEWAVFTSWCVKMSAPVHSAIPTLERQLGGLHTQDSSGLLTEFKGILGCISRPCLYKGPGSVYETQGYSSVGFSILSTTMVHTHNPRTGAVEAELRASLNNIVTLRPAWAI